MTDRVLFKAGSISAIVGAILAFIVNILHPRTSEFGNPEALLQLIARSSIWVPDHIGILLAVLLTLGGLVAIYRSIPAGPGGSWARLAVVAALVSASVSVVLIGTDGIAAKEVAVAWANAPAAEKVAAFYAANVLEQINFGLFSFFIFVYFGVTTILYGLAVATSEVFPVWLGWLAVLDGIGAALVGLVQATRGPSVLVTNVLFPIVSLIATVWVLIMGVLLWRKAGVAA